MHCFVAKRDEDPIAGFQRTLNESRADDIAGYLAAGTGSIPSNIILSAQPNAEFLYNRKTMSISFAREGSAFLVLDGQHRLWGYQKCSVRHRVPVAIYEGLTRAEETKLFIDINTTQRGVPAALLLDIKELADVEDAKEHTLRQIFDRLNVDPKSPLTGTYGGWRSGCWKRSKDPSCQPRRSPRPELHALTVVIALIAQVVRVADLDWSPCFSTESLRSRP